MKPFFKESVADKPGVFRIRATKPDEEGTVEAERILSMLCRVCFKTIGHEPFIEINGEPRHHRHVLERLQQAQ